MKRITIARFGGAVLVAFLVFGSKTATLAAQTAAPQPDAAQRAAAVAAAEHRPILLVGAGHGGPIRPMGSVRLMLPVGKSQASDHGLYAYRGPEVEATAGVNGARIALGLGGVAKPPSGAVMFAQDLLVGVTRTWTSPRGATPDSTYVGVEGGMAFLQMRVSAGVAHRVAGPRGPNGTIFTWGVGVQLGR